MIAKVIAHGRDRAEAIARLRRALSQMTVIVGAGPRTSRSCSTCSTARRCGPARSTRPGSTGSPPPTSTCRRRDADVGLVAAAIDAGDLFGGDGPGAFLGWASRGRPQADVDDRPRDRAAPRRPGLRGRRPAELGRRARGRAGRAARRGRRRAPRPGAQPAHVRRAHAAASCRRSQGSDHLVEVDGVAHRFSRDDAGVVRAPAAALVVGVDVAPATSSRPATARGGRGDEDGDRRRRAHRRSGARRPRRPQRAGRRRRAAVPHRAGRSTRPPDAPAAVACRARRAGRRRRADRGCRERATATCEAFVLGFDVDAGDAGRRAVADGAPCRDCAPGPRSWRSSTRSPTSSAVSASLATRQATRATARARVS